MLLDFRETIRRSKPLKYSLIALISIPFVLVGIGSYFSGRQAPPVASVDGEEISPQQLERAYNQQRQQLAQMFGGQIPEGFANEALLRRQALEQLVSQAVIDQQVSDQNFAVGDATLGREIRNLPIFQMDGRFDEDTYREQLRANGLSVAAFEQQFRADTAVNQFREGIAATGFLLAEEQRRLEALSAQTRTIDLLRFDLQAAEKKQTVSEDEAQAWFEEHAEEYRFPERVKLAYIMLDAAEIAEAIDVSEAEAQAWYEENRGNYVQPETRSASHILLELDDPDDADTVASGMATLEELRSRIQNGEAFDELAREYSQDVGSANSGGTLGEIEPGVMDAAFEEALYALENEGDVSEPVQTDFGLHLIKVDSITPESGKAFDEVKSEIIATLQQNQADRDFFEMREQLAELSFDNPESLDAAADATGLTIEQSDWIDSESTEPAMLTQPAVLQAAFSEEVLQEGINSDVIEIEPRKVIVLRVVEHEEPRPKSFGDVKNEVMTALREQKASDELDGAVEEALAALAEGADVNVLADAYEFAEASAEQTLTREDDAIDPVLVRNVFTQPRPSSEQAVTASVELEDGDRAAYRLTNVTTPDASKGEIQAVASQALGAVEFQSLVDSLRSRADIEISE